MKNEGGKEKKQPDDGEKRVKSQVLNMTKYSLGKCL